jgi:type III restriction enzyme
MNWRLMGFWPVRAARHTLLCTRCWMISLLSEREAFAEKRASVMTVEGRTIIANLKTGETNDGQFQADADDAVVSDAYRRTARIISPDIARTYTIERAKRKPEAKDDFDDALD